MLYFIKKCSYKKKYSYINFLLKDYQNESHLVNKSHRNIHTLKISCKSRVAFKKIQAAFTIFKVTLCIYCSYNCK